MFQFPFNSMRFRKLLTVLVLCALGMALPHSAGADKKKKTDPTPAPEVGPRKFPFDPTKLVWPAPPSIGRIHWMDYFAGEKVDITPAATAKPKATWMDRLAGTQSTEEKFNPKTFPFQLIGPYGRSKSGRCFYFRPEDPRHTAHPQRLRSSLRLD
jgi:hypothetical protein